MNAITQWVRNIIFIILFTALLEMFLPENNMSKYIRVVMGFFIITIMLSPFTAIFNQDFSAIQNMIPDRILGDDWGFIEDEASKIDDSNQILLKEYYQNRISAKISEVVNLHYQDYNHNINVSLDNDYLIENIHIILKSGEVKQIEQIRIDIAGNGQLEETDVKLSTYEMIKIRNLKSNISQVFQIPTDNIAVTMEKGG
ncbi:stage III sporulation protein AF [Natronospora cellulosivora (SeqCode)]